MFKDLFSTYQSVQPPPPISKKQWIVNYEDKYTPDMSDLYILNPELEVYDDVQPNTLELLFKPSKALTDKLSLSSNKDSILNAVNIARSFVGTKYTYGGSSPKTGFDCSGLILYAFKLSGINLPRTAAAIGKTGLEISSLNNAQVGDILFTKGTGPSGNHVKMISLIKEGLIYTIEAMGSKYGIVESKLTKTNDIRSIRRITLSNTTKASKGCRIERCNSIRRFNTTQGFASYYLKRLKNS